MHELLKTWTLYLASGIEAAAGAVIGAAALEAAIRSLLVYVRRSQAGTSTEEVRLRLGRWLALGLEFELAADILRTAVAPTWNEIGQLAAIIVLRTALNYFLQQEINRGGLGPADARSAPPGPTPPAASPTHTSPT